MGYLALFNENSSYSKAKNAIQKCREKWYCSNIRWLPLLAPDAGACIIKYATVSTTGDIFTIKQFWLNTSKSRKRIHNNFEFRPTPHLTKPGKIFKFPDFILFFLDFNEDFKVMVKWLWVQERIVVVVLIMITLSRYCWLVTLV